MTAKCLLLDLIHFMPPSFDLFFSLIVFVPGTSLFLWSLFGDVALVAALVVEAGALHRKRSLAREVGEIDAVVCVCEMGPHADTDPCDAT